MENWRQFVNETRLPSGDPFQRKATKKRFEAALGRSVEKGEVIALDDKFHQVFKIAKQMKVSVRFKSASEQRASLKTKANPKGKTGRYKYWSAVGLIVDKLEEEMKPIEGQMLNEGILDKLKTIYGKVKDFIVNIFEKIMSYISKGFAYLIDFLDLEPQVDVDPTVRTDV